MSDNLLESVSAWQAQRPKLWGDMHRDIDLFAPFWREGAEALARLPPKPQRDGATARAVESLLATARAARVEFLAAHSRELYDWLTDDRRHFIRLDELVAAAAHKAPGLVPDTKTLAGEKALMQAEKDGHEIDQGLLLNRFLGDPVTGEHLCHAMLLPKPESLELLPQFLRDGRIELEGAGVERREGVAFVTMRNPRFLNAEDESSLDGLETAVDLCLLDPECHICLLRGDYVEHPKYAPGRTFNAGINLTRLYQGEIPFLWYLRRDLGYVNKICRGLARPEITPEESMGDTTEKMWVAQVDSFAIGGGCQLLLVCDYVVAAEGAVMTLPARKEGIIPGFADLRLPRFVGDRIARRAIQSELRLECDSPEGRMICDEIAPAGEMEKAAEAAARRFLGSGAFGAIANRRALRIGLEPLDAFRRYAAYYAKAQAECHFSPQLIVNLERFWDARNRKV
jgi:thioesterase DpgC